MCYPKFFSILGFLGVILGAFGAHWIKDKVTNVMFENWKTATLYLFIHVIIGLIAFYITDAKRSQFCFAIGVIIFSGSLYLLVLLNFPVMGAITPIGGVFMLCGWIFLYLDLNIKITNKK